MVEVFSELDIVCILINIEDEHFCAFDHVIHPGELLLRLEISESLGYLWWLLGAILSPKDEYLDWIDLNSKTVAGEYEIGVITISFVVDE